MNPRLGAMALAALAPSLAFGQAAPEVKARGYYVGAWGGRGGTRGGALGPAGGKLSSRMTCEWFDERHHVVCRGEEKGPTGTRGFLNILGYDGKAKAYTEYSISSLGESEYDRGGAFADGKLVFLLDAGGTSQVRSTVRSEAGDL